MSDEHPLVSLVIHENVISKILFTEGEEDL